MKNILRVNNFNVIIKKGKKSIIKNLNFSVYEGEIIHLRGRNGSGKSTLIKNIILDSRNKYYITGEIIFDDTFDILKLRKYRDIINYRRTIGYVPQVDDYSGHINLTVRDVIQDSIDSYNGPKVNIDKFKEIFTKFRFNDESEKKFNLESNPSKLSGGQQRLLSILANVIARPKAKLYLIDEPLNNLDSENIKIILSLLNEIHDESPKSSFLIVSHNEDINFINKIIDLEWNKNQVSNLYVGQITEVTK